MDYETAMLPIANALGFKPGQTVDEGWANVSELLSDSERGIERRQALDAAVALRSRCRTTSSTATASNTGRFQIGPAGPRTATSPGRRSAIQPME